MKLSRLGHSPTTLTMDVYSHVMPGVAVEVAPAVPVLVTGSRMMMEPS
jgi:hypothetical protein